MAATRSVNANRNGVTICAILATLMQSLDSTISNVSLAYMQGSARLGVTRSPQPVVGPDWR